MKILIVIPHYGPDEYLKELLPTIKCSYKEMTGDCEIISETTEGVVNVLVINNNVENRGFTAACNLGIYRAIEGGFDACWLLNNDTKVVDFEDAVRQISKELAEHPDTGVIGCKVLSMEDPDFIHHAGTGNPIPAGVHKVGRVSQGQYTIPTLERWVTGASVILSRACMREIGFMDSRMHNYYSDSDYCYRARYAGYSVRYLPIEVQHKIGQSAQPSKAQELVMKRDMLAFYSKWITGKAFSDLNLELLPNKDSA